LKNKPVLVQLPPDLIERCHTYGASVATHYGSGEKIHAMPWTRDQMTKDELRQLASREEAGRLIDVETCELGRWAAYDADPYGIR
jgi:hypothetical protein